MRLLSFRNCGFVLKLAVFLLCGALFILYLVLSDRVEYVGHADIADTGVVARNFLAGRGFTVDLVWHFLRDYPEVSHPEDTWPLGPSLLLIPFYAVMGATAAATRFPNIFLNFLVVPALTWVFARRIAGIRTAFLAVALTVLSPVGLEAALTYPADLLFTSLALVTLLSCWIAAQRMREGGSRAPLVYACLGGLTAGLSIWAKQTGLPLSFFCLAWLAWDCLRAGKTGRRGPLLPAAYITCAGIVSAPVFLRNFLLFNGPLTFGVHSSLAALALRGRDWETAAFVLRTPAELAHLSLWSVLREYPAEVIGHLGRNAIHIISQFPPSGRASVLILALAVYGLPRFARRAPELLATLAAFFFFSIVSLWIFGRLELRYLHLLIPFVNISAACSVIGVSSWVRRRVAFRQRLSPAVLRFGVVLAWTVLLLGPPLVSYSRVTREFMEPSCFPAAGRWLTAHTAPSTVVMSRNPWELSFHSARRTVMIPNGDRAAVLDVARRHNVRYLALDTLDYLRRPALDELYRRHPSPEVALVYEDLTCRTYWGQGFLIYRTDGPEWVPGAH